MSNYIKNWNKEFFLNIIEKEEVEIINNNKNSLTVYFEPEDYISYIKINGHLFFDSLDIKSEEHLHFRIARFGRLFIHYNFKLKPENPKSIMLFEVDDEGEIIRSWLKNGYMVPFTMREKFNFENISYRNFEEELAKIDNKYDKFHFICQHGTAKEYHEFVSDDGNFTNLQGMRNIDYEIGFSLAATNNNFEIVNLFLKNEKINQVNYRLISELGKDNNYKMLEVLLKDKRILELLNEETMKRLIIGNNRSRKMIFKAYHNKND